MTDLVPADQIERIVGIERHPTQHYARLSRTDQSIYILHSAACRDSGIDLRYCPLSQALDYRFEAAWELMISVPDAPTPVEERGGLMALAHGAIAT